MHDKELILIVEQIAECLIKNNKRLAVAESCTGGWVAKVLTDMAGCSAWFDRGFVTYTNESKHEMLGVTESSLNTHGAVSETTVIEMALGALKMSHADYSLSISGIAGPGGGSTEKPVGLVWFSWAEKKDGKQHTLSSEQHVFDGDRDSVRRQAVMYTLKSLLKYLNACLG